MPKITSAMLSMVIIMLLTACNALPALPTMIAVTTEVPALPSQVTPAVVAFGPTAVATALPTMTVIAQASATPEPPATQTPVPTLTLTPVPPTLAPSETPVPTAVPFVANAVVSGAEGVNLRAGPGTQFEPPLTLLNTNTPLQLIARSPDFLWYKVQTSEGQQGWAYRDLLTISNEPPDLPVEDGQQGIIVVQSPGLQPLTNGTGTPVTITDRMRQVFQLGQEMGNNPRVFIKVGDSVTDQQAFMVGFGTGEYDLGSYGYLQTSLDYFSKEAFARDSLAAEPAFNSGSVMDSFRVPEEGLNVCQPQEKPLECEMRVMKPAFAVILFGGNEVRSMDIDSFTNQMQQLIDLTTSRGVIPIFNTFPHATNFHENAEAFNEALRAMALDQQIPLIDLAVAVRPLPNEGIELEDGFHLSMLGIRTAPDNRIMLNGDEKVYGAILRNLLTLQMLDGLRIGLGLS